MYRTERVLKYARKKHPVMYRGRPIRITPDFTTEILKARRPKKNEFQILKSRDANPDYYMRLS